MSIGKAVCLPSCFCSFPWCHLFFLQSISRSSLPAETTTQPLAHLKTISWYCSYLRSFCQVYRAMSGLEVCSISSVRNPALRFRRFCAKSSQCEEQYREYVNTEHTDFKFGC